MSESGSKKKTARLPHLWEALLTFAVMIVVMAIGIVVFHVDPHMPMFIGTLFAAVMALHLGSLGTKSKRVCLTAFTVLFKRSLFLL